MSPSNWNEAETQRAKEIWAEYPRQHDVSPLHGKTAGIDPVSGRIWFGESARDIGRQRQAEGINTPIYGVRVGYDYYGRKGESHR